MSSKSILIIDDDDGVRGMLSTLFKLDGYSVDSAETGDEALEKISGKIYDLVVADLMLPRRGGFEVLRRMQTGDSENVPVIVITGRAADSSTVEMIRRERNVAEFMQKPVKTQTLLACVHRLLDA